MRCARVQVGAGTASTSTAMRAVGTSSKRASRSTRSRTWRNRVTKAKRVAERVVIMVTPSVVFGVGPAVGVGSPRPLALILPHTETGEAQNSLSLNHGTVTTSGLASAFPAFGASAPWAALDSE